MKPELSQPSQDQPIVLDDHENPRQWPAAKKCKHPWYKLLVYDFLTV